MPILETRVAQAKAWDSARVRTPPAEPVDRSAWDWYAESCSCGHPPGNCRVHPRARLDPAPARGRLAGLGLYRRPRRRQDARARRGFSSGSTTAP